jgi:hypothetical protein
MTSLDRPAMSRRERLMWTYRIAGPAGALGMAALFLLLFHARPGEHAVSSGRLAGGLVMVVVIMAWTFAFAYLTARQEDEYTLTAAKFAWFWGGLIGLVCSAPVLAFLAWRGMSLIDPKLLPPSRAALPLILGYLLAIVFQLVGYMAARIWWRVRRP